MKFLSFSWIGARLIMLLCCVHSVDLHAQEPANATVAQREKVLDESLEYLISRKGQVPTWLLVDSAETAVEWARYPVGAALINATSDAPARYRCTRRVVEYLVHQNSMRGLRLLAANLHDQDLQDVALTGVCRLYSRSGDLDEVLSELENIANKYIRAQAALASAEEGQLAKHDVVFTTLLAHARNLVENLIAAEGRTTDQANAGAAKHREFSRELCELQADLAVASYANQDVEAAMQLIRQEGCDDYHRCRALEACVRYEATSGSWRKALRLYAIAGVDDGIGGKASAWVVVDALADAGEFEKARSCAQLADNAVLKAHVERRYVASSPSFRAVASLLSTERSGVDVLLMALAAEHEANKGNDGDAHRLLVEANGEIEAALEPGKTFDESHGEALCVLSGTSKQLGDKERAGALLEKASGVAARVGEVPTHVGFGNVGEVRIRLRIAREWTTLSREVDAAKEYRRAWQAAAGHPILQRYCIAEVSRTGRVDLAKELIAEADISRRGYLLYLACFESARYANRRLEWDAADQPLWDLCIRLAVIRAMNCRNTLMMSPDDMMLPGPIDSLFDS